MTRLSRRTRPSVHSPGSRTARPAGRFVLSPAAKTRLGAAKFLAQAGPLEPLDKVNKSFRLGLQAVQDLRAGQPAPVIEQAVHLREENALGIDVSVPITENLLQL